MDKSTEYIKMCEKATEIQTRNFKDNSFKGLDWCAVYSELREPDKFPRHMGYPKHSPYYVDKWHRASDKNAEYSLRLPECGVLGAHRPGQETSSWYGQPECLIDHKYIWLPRQEQLQQMVGVDDSNLIAELHSLMEFTHQYKASETYERLWLRYLMFSKYKKQWNGEDWVVG